MHTKTLNRRDFLKKVGMAGAAIAVMPTAKAVGMLAKPEEASTEVNPKWSKDNFFEQVTFMFHKAAELKAKAKGVFRPPEHTFFVEVPRWMADDMMATTNQYGINTWKFLKEVWPKSLWARTYTGEPLTMTCYFNGFKLEVRA